MFVDGSGVTECYREIVIETVISLHRWFEKIHGREGTSEEVSALLQDLGAHLFSFVVASRRMDRAGQRRDESPESLAMQYQIHDEIYERISRLTSPTASPIKLTRLN